MIALNSGCAIFPMKRALPTTRMHGVRHAHQHLSLFAASQKERAPSTCLDRLSCRPLKPAKDWLRMMPLGPPGEKDWDPTSMISGSLVGSPVRQMEDRGDCQAGSHRIPSLLTFRGITRWSDSPGPGHEGHEMLPRLP